MQSIPVILNRFAKGEKAIRMEEGIRALSPRVELLVTGAPDDAEAFARDAVRRGCRTVVAAGGDGTVNQVVNGIADSDATLGILPAGTMNVYAAELGIPGNLREAWELIAAGHTRAVDLARANERYFVQMAGVGLDAQIVQETSYGFRKNFGPASYVLTAMQIAARKPPELAVEISDGPPRKGSFVLVGNGRYYGGPFVIFKDAVPDDGLLDVLIFKNRGYIDLIRYVQGVIFGNHTTLDDVEYFQCRELRVDSADEVPIEVDGELIGSVPVEFTIQKQRLKVHCP